MRMNCNPRIREDIEEMLRLGMKVGEIQALFPNIRSVTIHSIGKEIGINTRIKKDASYVANRNTEKIKEYVKNAMKEGIVEKSDKALFLLSVIDTLAPTSNGRYENFTKREKRLKEEKEKVSKQDDLEK